MAQKIRNRCRCGLKMSMAHPTGCATCTTFRHRHRRRSRLIETAEIEPGKAETGEKKAVCEEHACPIRRKGSPPSPFLLLPLSLSPHPTQHLSLPHLHCRPTT